MSQRKDPDRFCFLGFPVFQKPKMPKQSCKTCVLYILFFKNKFILFIYFWLRWVFVAAHGLSLAEVSRGYSSLQCAGFSLQWLLLLRSRGSRLVGFSSCGTQAQQLWLAGSRAQAQ